MEEHLVDALKTVFANFPEEHRAQLISWASEEVQGRSPIQLLTDAEGRIWKIGDASPTNEHCLVFAMLLDTGAKCVDIYIFAQTEDGGSLYFKETCWQPAHTYGPISPGALFTEWQNYFAATPDEPDEPEEPEAKHTNGRATP